uniref:Uncharacterized protein n=1 Tax=Rhizophora mucronata TaxID=61149 RepID=A0A2P2P748_RHIMU
MIRLFEMSMYKRSITKFIWQQSLFGCML